MLAWCPRIGPLRVYKEEEDVIMVFGVVVVAGKGVGCAWVRLVLYGMSWVL